VSGALEDEQKTLQAAYNQQLQQLLWQRNLQLQQLEEQYDSKAKQLAHYICACGKPVRIGSIFYNLLTPLCRY
jgi:hypothetical protein